MSECNNPECKEEFRLALRDMADNLYGEGPDGDGGVYGELKKKVSYSVLWILITFLSGFVGSSITFALMHEGRLSKIEVVAKGNKEAADKTAALIESIRTSNNVQFGQILSEIQRIKK